MENIDYYKILALEKNANPEEIKDAYRELALKHHPDRNRNDAKAVEKMKQINEAYAVLSDPAKKREYDTLRRQFGQSARSQFRQSYSEQDIFSGSDIHHIFEELSRSLGLRGFDEIFREFYGRGYRKRFRFGGSDFLGGGFFFFSMFGKGRHQQLPFLLSGLGKIADFMFKKPPGEKISRKSTDIHDVINLSPDHAEKGGPYAYFHLKKNKKLVVKIPPNVRTGQRIRLSGMGSDGKNNGSTGDLYLRVSINKPLITKTKNLLGRLLRKR